MLRLTSSRSGASNGLERRLNHWMRAICFLRCSQPGCSYSCGKFEGWGKVGRFVNCVEVRGREGIQLEDWLRPSLVCDGRLRKRLWDG